MRSWFRLSSFELELLQCQHSFVMSKINFLGFFFFKAGLMLPFLAYLFLVPLWILICSFELPSGNFSIFSYWEPGMCKEYTTEIS